VEDSTRKKKATRLILNRAAMVRNARKGSTPSWSSRLALSERLEKPLQGKGEVAQRAPWTEEQTHRIPIRNSKKTKNVVQTGEEEDQFVCGSNARSALGALVRGTSRKRAERSKGSLPRTVRPLGKKFFFRVENRFKREAKTEVEAPIPWGVQGFP